MTPEVRARWRRVARIAVRVAAVVIPLYLAVTAAQVWRAAGRDQARPVDAIVVMGAAQYDGRPSPQLQARLDHALELYRNRLAPLIVVTGGNQPGDRFTEASASLDYLVDQGVPEEAILFEDDGTTTHESLEAVAELLAARDFDEVLIVTDPFHALRARLTAESVGLTAVVSPVPDGVDGFGRKLAETGGVAVGRLIGFGRLSAITG